MVPTDPRTSPELHRPRYFGQRGRPGEQTPQLTGRSVTQYRIGATSEHRRHPPPLHGELGMTDGVDPLMQTMQGAPPQPTFDPSPPNAQAKQLRPGHDPVLPGSDLRNRPIDVLARFPRLTRPAFSVSEMGNAGFVGHATDGEAARRAGGAHRVTTLQRKRGSNPPLPPLALIPSNEGGCLLPIPRDRETYGSRAVCVGSNGETALVRVRASVQPYHRVGAVATVDQSRFESSNSASLQLSGGTRRAMSPRPKRSRGQSAVKAASMPASARA
jgi:hypothetical protein